MPKLTDTINASGQPAQADEQEQAAQAGAQAGLMTPLFGQTPDQAKMMGTQAQKTSSLTDAIRYGIQEEMDLQTTERRSDWNRQVEGQPGQQDDVTDWANIANISTNVQQKTEAAINQAMEDAAKTMNQENVTAALHNFEVASQYIPPDSEYATYDEAYQEAQENYNAVLEKFKAGKVGYKAMSRAAGKRAYASMQRSEAYRKDSEWRQAQFDAVWESLQAGEVPDAAAMTTVKALLGVETDEDVMEKLAVNLDEIEMGKALTGAEIFHQGVDEEGNPIVDPLMAEIAGTLGLTDAEVAEMSVREIQDAISGVQAEKFDTGAELRTLATDPSLSEVERAQFAQALKDYGAISGEQAEMEFQDLIDSMDGAETIQFGDETYSIEQIFEDAEFTSVIKEYLDADEATREKMREEEGFAEFADFIEKHEEVLTQMTANIQVAIDEGEELTAEGTAAKMSKDGTTEIPDFVFEDFLGYVPDPSDLHNREWMEEIQNSSMYRMYYDPEQFAKDVGGIETADVTKFIGLMGTLRDIDPNFMARMDDMSEAELRKYIAPQADGSSLMEKTLSTQEDIDHLSTMADTNTPDGAAAFYAELGGDATTLQSMLDTYAGAESIGVQPDAATASFLKLLDFNEDGILDDAATIQQRIDGMGDTPFSQRLRDHEGRGITMDAAQNLTDFNKSFPEGSLNQLLVSSLTDGKIDATEMQSFSNLTLEELMQVQDLHGDKIDNEAASTLNEIMINKKYQEIDTHLAALEGLPPNFSQEIGPLMALMGEGREWLGSADPVKYQKFRQLVTALQKVEGSGALEGLPQHVIDFANDALGWAERDHERAGTMGMTAYHPDQGGWQWMEDESIPIEERNFASWLSHRWDGTKHKQRWTIWDRTVSPPKLIGVHDNPNAIAAWQTSVLNGERPITDTEGVGLEGLRAEYNK